jgi:hypothetical protein
MTEQTKVGVQSENIRDKLNLETATMNWRELQRFFAAGKVLWASNSLDLIDVAVSIAEDNGKQIESWMKTKIVAVVSDTQAQTWFKDDTLLWSVVVYPWVLVQVKQESAIIQVNEP